MQELEIMSGNVGAITKVELDSAIATAKAYPRDLAQFMTDAKATIASSFNIAKSCLYSLKREDKKTKEVTIIEGKSIRLAEIAFCNYGNLKAGGRIKELEQKIVKVEAAIIDLQKNNTVTMEQARSIWSDKGSYRYSTDMIVTTTNAALAIAFRNAVFKIIPGSFLEELFLEAKKVVNGTPEQLKQKIGELVAAFDDADLKIEDYLKYYKINSIDEIKTGHIGALHGMLNAIKDGVFDSSEEEKPISKTAKLNEELRTKEESTKQFLKELGDVPQ